MIIVMISFGDIYQNGFIPIIWVIDEPLLSVFQSNWVSHHLLSIVNTIGVIDDADFLEAADAVQTIG